jgi:hypothetical protein
MGVLWEGVVSQSELWGQEYRKKINRCLKKLGLASGENVRKHLKICSTLRQFNMERIFCQIMVLGQMDIHN